MEVKEIILSRGDIENTKLRISSCPPGFFPKDALGPSREKDGTGNLITLRIGGIDTVIRTDIPTDKNKKSRGFFRRRGWCQDLFEFYELKPGDRINIIRLAEREYKIEVVPSPCKLKFIDLFAGIGGIRKAFEKAGARCVFSSEWNTYAAKTYACNFGEKPDGDITKIQAAEIPDHDILTAGFPCQPFSIAGVSKKNSLGIAHGFADKTQGTLFFDILRILKEKKPRAFLLENVRNLQSHDKGRTYLIVKSSLEELGYYVQDSVIDGIHCVPQHRERIYIVGTLPAIKFNFPTVHELENNYRIATTLGEILDKSVPDRYTLTSHLWTYLKNYKEKHQKAGNGFGYGLVGPNETTRTISARYYKDGSEILYHPQGTKILNENPQKSKPRRLTPRECARLMGFDSPGKSDFIIPVSDTQAYKQFGNSVVVPVVSAIAHNLVTAIARNEIIKFAAQQDMYA